MVKNIIKLIKKENGAYKKHFYLTKKTTPLKILYFFSPFIEITLKSIQSDLTKLNPCKFSVDDKTLLKIILAFFESDIFPMIQGVIVLEINSFWNSQKNNTSKNIMDFILNFSNTESLLRLLEKYSELKKTLLISVGEYINQKIRLFQRLSNDAQLIKKKFNFNYNQLTVKNIIDSGDKHGNGDVVSLISFSNKQDSFDVVYKPRSLDIHRPLSELIDFINHKARFDIRLPKTLQMDSYGWQGFITHSPCRSEKDISSFYYNLGGLLGIFHLLNSRDIHAENIIASGKYPILVDSECVLSPVYSHNNKAYMNMRNIVCNTLILPIRVMATKTHQGYDNSVIGGNIHEKLPLTKYVLSYEKNKLNLIRENLTLHNLKNKPFLIKKATDPSDYENNFLKGFEKIYTFILENKNHILYSKECLLSLFEDKYVRVVFRPTAIYKKLLLEANHPKLLYDGLARKNHFSFLKKTMKYCRNFMPINKNEIKEITNNNIPLFYCLSSKRSTYDSLGSHIQVSAKINAIQHIITNFSLYWGKNDLNLQKIIIKNSFSAFKGPSTPLLSKKKRTYNKLKQNRKYDIKYILKNTLEKIYDLAITEKNTVSWPTITKHGNTLSGNITDATLSTGSVGILYTLGLAGNILNVKKYKDFSEYYLEKIISCQDYMQEVYPNIGLYNGLSGLLYAINNLSCFYSGLTKKNHIRNFQNAFSEITKGQPDAYNIADGLSGFIILEASLKKNTKALLKNKLLSAKNKTREYVAKETVNETPVSLGYPEGLAGIDAALRKSHKESSYKPININPLINALSVENPDISWKTGVTGILLSLTDDLSKKNLTINLLPILDNIEKNFTSHDWTLGTGNLALLECLDKFSYPAHKAFIASKTDELLERLTYGDILFANLPDVFVPGLLDGLSGICYFLMKQLYSKLPSVLTI